MLPPGQNRGARPTLVPVPEFLQPDRFGLDLADGVPTITLADAQPSSTEGWSVLNRLTLLVVDGPGDEGYLLPRLNGNGGDAAPAGWDDSVERHSGVDVVANGVRFTASLTGY